MTKNEHETSEVPDTVRERFREALERKKAGQHASTAPVPGESHVGHSQTEAARRQFRRKSG